MNWHRIACLFVVALLLWSLASSFVRLPIFPYVYAATIFESDFEGADTEWTGTATSGSGVLDLNCVYTPYAGSECGDFNVSEGGAHEAYAYKTFATSYNNVTYSAWHRWNTTAEWRKFLKIGDSAGDSICTLMMSYSSWRMFYWNGYESMNQTTVSHTISANCYQNITLVSWMSNVNGYHKLYINSTLVIDMTGLNNTAEGNIGSVYVGFLYNSAYNNQNFRVDNVKAVTAEAEDYPPYWTTCQTNNTLAGNDTRIRTYWNDAYGLSHYYFEHNNTGTYETQTIVAFGGYPEWANHDFVLNDTVDAIVRWRSFANDTVDQWSNTTWQTITINANEVPQYGAINYNTTQADAPCNFTCEWTDDFGLSGFIFGSNSSTGVLTNETWVSLTGTSNLSSCVITLNDTQGIRINYQFWCNDTANEWNTTGLCYLVTGGLNDFYAENGTAKGIQAAVNQAEASGERPANIHIPAGWWEWTPVEDGWYQVNASAGINLFGVSTFVNRDADGIPTDWYTNINITWDVQGNDSIGIPTMFSFSGDADHDSANRCRFTDIRIEGYRSWDHSDYSMGEMFRAIAMKSIVDWRIDHCNFTHVTGGNWMSGDNANEHCRGVFDHNWCYNQYGSPEPYETRTIGYCLGLGNQYNTVWMMPINETFGQYTNYTVFIENNWFCRWRHAYCGNHGMHIVFRNNTVYRDFGFGSIDSHGKYSYVGTRAVEVYNNTFVYPAWNGHSVSFHRGGAGIYTDNYAINNESGQGYYSFITFADEGDNETQHPHDVYYWDNNKNNIPYAATNGTGATYLDVDYFLRAPSLGVEGWEWTPYTYPHPLITEQDGGGASANYVVLNQPTHQQSLVIGDIKFNFTATFYVGSIDNASLWLNISDTWQRVGWNTSVVENDILHTINYTFSTPAVYVWNIQVFNSTTSHFAPSNYTLTVLAGYTFSENPSLVAVFALDMTQRLISPTSLLPSFTWPDFATLLSGFVTAYWVYPVAIIGMVAVGLVVLYYGRATPYDYVRSAPWLLVMAAIGLICVFVYYIVITYILGAFA